MEDNTLPIEPTSPIETTTKQVEPTPTPEPKPDDKSYIKLREEKAQKQLLKKLGVENIDEALTALGERDELIKKVNDLEKKFEQAEKDKTNQIKTRQLTSMLEAEKVFDSDALLHYIDIDKIELDTNGKIKESDKIVAELKALKPNYFGKEFIKSDTHTQGNPNPITNEYEADYKSGNYVGAISKYLKQTTKK